MGALDDIPVEIMRRIFDFYMGGFSATSPAKLHNPDILCGVCTTWRDVAVNHPPLWSDIVIRAIRRPPEERNVQYKREYSASSFQISHPQAAHLTARLARIGAFPMTLRIIFNPTYAPSGADYEKATPLGKFFEGKPLSNLRLLHVYGFEGDIELYPLYLPKLESMVMEDIRCLAPGNGDAASFPTLSCLRRFALKDMPLRVLPLTFPWSQLSHLYLQAWFNLTGLHTILLATSGLEELFVKFMWLAHSATLLPRPEGTRMTSLDNLTRCTLVGDNPDYPYRENLLTTFHWPTLTHLRLLSGTLNWNAKVPRHCSSLTHLSISSSSTPSIFDVESLDFCPSLVQLIIDIKAPIDHATLFRALSFDALKPRLPNLEELGITCVIRPAECPWWYTRNQLDAFASLRHLIGSRTLQHVSATTPPTHLKRLALLINQGREYNPVAKEVGDILRSFSHCLKQWWVMRGTGGEKHAFNEVFDSWEGGHLAELVACLR